MHCGTSQPADNTTCTGCGIDMEALVEWSRGRVECETHGYELERCGCPTPEWLRLGRVKVAGR